MVESDGRRFAFNPEPKWRWFWNVRLDQPFRSVTDDEIASEIPPDDFYAMVGFESRVDRDAEWWLQQASIGLAQVMGAVARERGFAGPDLLALTDPYVNLGIAVPLLASLIRRFGESGGVAAYNAGPGGRGGEMGLAYAGKVLGREQELLA